MYLFYHDLIFLVLITVTYPGRGVYISGLPYSLENSRILYRSLFYSLQKEYEINVWFAANVNCEVNVYPEIKKAALVNNTNLPLTTVLYDGSGKAHTYDLKPAEIKWEDYDETGTIK